MLVSRAEQLRPEELQDTANPLHFGEVILYPNLGTPLNKATMPAIGFFFSVYGKDLAAREERHHRGARGAAGAGAHQLAQLAAPDAKGRIQHAGALPLKGLAPGDYTLKVSVSDGERSRAAHASFTVVE